MIKYVGGAIVGFVAIVASVFIGSGETYSVEMPICSGGKRITCVVDGDTIWLEGEKIRLEGK